MEAKKVQDIMPIDVCNSKFANVVIMHEEVPLKVHVGACMHRSIRTARYLCCAPRAPPKNLFTKDAPPPPKGKGSGKWLEANRRRQLQTAKQQCPVEPPPFSFAFTVSPRGSIFY